VRNFCAARSIAGDRDIGAALARDLGFGNTA
jgi:hypothetical protein